MKRFVVIFVFLFLAMPSWAYAQEKVNAEKAKVGVKAKASKEGKKSSAKGLSAEVENLKAQQETIVQAQTASTEAQAEMLKAQEAQAAKLAEIDAKIAELHKLQAEFEKMKVEQVQQSKEIDKQGKRVEEVDTRLGIKGWGFGNGSGNRVYFGSYGRIMAAIDPSTGDLTHGSAIDGMVQRSNQASFSDISFTYIPYLSSDGTSVSINHTSGFFYDPIFMDGFSHSLDNLYVEVSNLAGTGLRFWGGKRLFKGDNNYLYDKWPIEFIPVTGGGFGYVSSDGNMSIDYILSFQKLNQTVVPGMVKQRGGHMSMLKYRHRFTTSTAIPTIVVHMYGEFRTIEELFISEQMQLKDDTGWAVGGELELSGFMPNSFVRIFMRAAGGISTYGYNEAPVFFDSNNESTDAFSFMLALDSAFDSQWVGVRLASHMKYFDNGDGKDAKEGSADGIWASYVGRIHGYVGEYFRPGIEIAHHFVKYNEVDDLAQEFKLSIAPELTTARGINDLLPRLRLIYTISFLNDEAKALRGLDDNTEHYLGLGAQWLFF